MTKNMTKDEEIHQLRELFEADSYFSDEFSEQDVDQMCQNIQNDHPLLLNTRWVKFSKKQRQLVKELIKEKITSLTKTIENAENDSHVDSAKIILIKEECIDLIFASNHL